MVSASCSASCCRSSEPRRYSAAASAAATAVSRRPAAARSCSFSPSRDSCRLLRAQGMGGNAYGYGLLATKEVSVWAYAVDLISTGGKLNKANPKNW